MAERATPNSSASSPLLCSPAWQVSQTERCGSAPLFTARAARCPNHRETKHISGRCRQATRPSPHRGTANRSRAHRTNWPFASTGRTAGKRAPTRRQRNRQRVRSGHTWRRAQRRGRRRPCRCRRGRRHHDGGRLRCRRRASRRRSRRRRGRRDGRISASRTCRLFRDDAGQGLSTNRLYGIASAQAIWPSNSIDRSRPVRYARRPSKRA
jgi:hypothetical protein